VASLPPGLPGHLPGLAHPCIFFYLFFFKKKNKKEKEGHDTQDICFSFSHRASPPLHSFSFIFTHPTPPLSLSRRTTTHRRPSPSLSQLTTAVVLCSVVLYSQVSITNPCFLKFVESALL
jgi:hypothetical protein